MFDLDQGIAEWRRQMVAGGIKTPVPLEELESHLREDIEKQICSGTDAEPAFAAAIKRMGDGGSLKREFEKVQDSEKARRRNRWRVVSTFAGTGFAYSVIFVTLIFERRSAHVEITSGELFLVLGSMVATLLFGLVGRYFAKFLPNITNEWRQAAVIVVGIFLGAALFRLVWAMLPLNNIIEAQLALLWTMSPLLGIGNLFGAWIDLCSGRRKRMIAANA